MRLRQRVHTELNARGLCDAHGRFDPRVETWLGLLSQPAVSVDALHIPGYEQPPVAVLAAADERNAVLALQDSDGIWVWPSYPDGLASAVVGLLPGGQRGTEASVTLPLDEAMHIVPDRMATGTRAAEQEDEQAQNSRRGQRRQRSLADRSGDQRQAYARLAGQPRFGGGQLGANSRNAVGQKQRAPALAWFDTATGRYLSLSRAGSDGREWLTVSPADSKTLRGRLSEMIDSITRER